MNASRGANINFTFEPRQDFWRQTTETSRLLDQLVAGKFDDQRAFWRQKLAPLTTRVVPDDNVKYGARRMHKLIRLHNVASR